MAERSLRGIRLGSSSMQTEEGVVFHQRAQHSYRCSECKQDTVLTFAADAELPETWECRNCSAEAFLVNADGTSSQPEPEENKEVRSHWDMLLERRTIPELEELLEDRLTYLRERRGEIKTSA